MKPAALALMLMLAPFAQAEQSEVYIHFGMLSKHFDDKEHNEDHELIGLEWRNWYAGYYPNSDDLDSYFIFRNYRWFHLFSKVHLGARIGAITGYDFLKEIPGTKITPVLIPALFLDYQPVSVDFNILGPVVSVEFKFIADF